MAPFSQNTEATRLPASPRNLSPASWVLADSFDVAALELLIPDDVLEGEPGLELVACATCEGNSWLESYGSAWGGSCELWGRPDLNFTLKPCTRCHCEGEVLDFLLFVPALALLRLAA